MEETTMKTENQLGKWRCLSILSLLCGCFTFYKGIDRMVNYHNPEYSIKDRVNVYVGGDAYNYIINGTHATAFFVLTTMFVLAAIGLLIIHYVSEADKRAKTEAYCPQKYDEKNNLLEKQVAAEKDPVEDADPSESSSIP